MWGLNLQPQDQESHALLPEPARSPKDDLFALFKKCSFIYFERESKSMRAREEGSRERERENPKQTPNPVQSPTRGLISQP